MRKLSIWGITLFASIGSHGQSLDHPSSFDLGDKWTYAYTNLAENKSPFTYTMLTIKADEQAGFLYVESEDPMPSARTKYILRFEYAMARDTAGYEYTQPGILGDSYFKYESSTGDFQFPLFHGKKYSVEFPAVGLNPKSFSYRGEVFGPVKVKVPAGEFDAYRIELTGQVSRPYKSDVTVVSVKKTIWFAPEIKRPVKTEYFERNRRGRIEEKWVEELTLWEPQTRVPIELTFP